jgi:DNA repair protein RecN (Recombination protein N)
MLVELRIKGLAIIHEVDILFSKGLNVLTGETGAGKSIIINAVNMLLGDRSPEGLVRTGAEEATVEALFDVSEEPEAAERLRAIGVADTREILVKRTVTPSGRSKVFVNGDLSTLTNLSRIGETLLSIYGQHEHQSLQKADKHIDILDEYGGLRASRKRYDEAFRELERFRGELFDLKEAEHQTIKERDLMAFQSQEIASAQLHPEEEEELKERKTILANVEKLFECADLAERIVYSDEASVCERLDAALQKVRDITRIDPSLETLAKSLESSVFQLEEVAYTLRAYRGKIDCDPDALEAVEQRLDEIRRLKLKYGQTIQEILEFRGRIDHQLETLDSNARRIGELEERITEAEQKTVELACDLSAERKETGAAFQKAMEDELSSLGMERAVLEVRFGADRLAAREKWAVVQGIPLGPKGMDTVEFYISTNLGEEPKPLSRIASGGELSRIMLAVKRIIAAAEPGQTLIFDEVDSGIGGAVSEVVGKKLKNLSLYHQVLCVTHLPQIACFGDLHYRVAKIAKRNRTITQVKALNAEERVDEIARMLGGIKITEKTRAHASEMIENARTQQLTETQQAHGLG